MFQSLLVLALAAAPNATRPKVYANGKGDLVLEPGNGGAVLADGVDLGVSLMDLRSLIQSQAALIGRQNETLKQQQHLIKELGDRITKLETQVPAAEVMIDQLNQTTQELEKKIPAAAETVDTAARWPWGSHAAVKKDTSVRERMIATASKVVNVRIPTEGEDGDDHHYNNLVPTTAVGGCRTGAFECEEQRKSYIEWTLSAVAMQKLTMRIVTGNGCDTKERTSEISYTLDGGESYEHFAEPAKFDNKNVDHTGTANFDTPFTGVVTVRAEMKGDACGVYVGWRLVVIDPTAAYWSFVAPERGLTKVQEVTEMVIEERYGQGSGSTRFGNNQQNKWVSGGDEGRVRHASLNGYAHQENGNGHWTLANSHEGKFDLFWVDNNMVVQVEVMGQHYAGKDFAYEQWIVGTGSGGRGQDRCSVTHIEGITRRENDNLPRASLVCAGDAILYGDRSGYRRIQIQMDDFAGGQYWQVKVTVLSQPSIDPLFWILAPYSVSKACFADHQKCGADTGKNAYRIADCNAVLRKCLYKWRDCNDKSHHGLESCDKLRPGPYTVL